MKSATATPALDGRIILDTVVGAGHPWAGIVAQGQVLRIIDLEGSQAVDLLCYNAHDRIERYHAPNTMQAAGTVRLTTGHVLYSDLARDRKSVVEGKSVSVRVDHGGRRFIIKKKYKR